MNLVLRYDLGDGAELGSMPVNLIDAQGVDDPYEALQRGTPRRASATPSQSLHDPHGPRLGCRVSALSEGRAGQ